MAGWISLADAVATKGVRLVLARFGVPSPWSEFSDSLALLLAHRDQMYRESMTLPVPTV